MRSHIFIHLALLFLLLSLLFSKWRLKRKDFQEIARLPWAQEVPSSNPCARPITSLFFRNFESLLLMVESPPLSHYQRGTIQVPRPVRKNGKTVDPAT